jgi:hypothetical protein
VNSAKSNSPDGEIVEKGGQAYKLRSTTSRTVMTCLAAACTELKDFNSTNVSQTDLGAATVAERDALISWAKGMDVDDEKQRHHPHRNAAFGAWRRAHPCRCRSTTADAAQCRRVTAATTACCAPSTATATAG